jgi:hypothetical protein
MATKNKRGETIKVAGVTCKRSTKPTDPTKCRAIWITGQVIGHRNAECFSQQCSNNIWQPEKSQFCYWHQQLGKNFTEYIPCEGTTFCKAQPPSVSDANFQKFFLQSRTLQWNEQENNCRRLYTMLVNANSEIARLKTNDARLNAEKDKLLQKLKQQMEVMVLPDFNVYNSSVPSAASTTSTLPNHSRKDARQNSPRPQNNKGPSTILP